MAFAVHGKDEGPPGHSSVKLRRGSEWMIGVAMLLFALSRAGRTASTGNAISSRSKAAMTADNTANVEHDAHAPSEIPPRGWYEVLRRVWDEIGKDNMSIIAAGCGFYALLSLFPAITALVAIYGLAADPATIEQQLGQLGQIVPQEAVTLLIAQAHAVAAAGSTKLSWSAALALALALYSATSGVKTFFEALNIAYEEQETRSFLRLNLTALIFTIAAVVSIAVMIAVIVALPVVLDYLPLGPVGDWLIRIGSWLLLVAIVMSGLALLYRFGPSRAPARWRWITPGSLAAGMLWLAGSLAFSLYVARFAAYNQTYGALGGVVVLLMWLYLSAFVILLGAELNAELELQTEQDTTTGPSKPVGRRQAYVADHTAVQRRF